MWQIPAVQLQFTTTPLSSSIHSLFPLSATLFVPYLLRPSPATPPDKAQVQQQDTLLQAQGCLCPFHSSSSAAGRAGRVPGTRRYCCPCGQPVFVTVTPSPTPVKSHSSSSSLETPHSPLLLLPPLLTASDFPEGFSRGVTLETSQ